MVTLDISNKKKSLSWVNLFNLPYNCIVVFSQRAKKYMKQFAVEINLGHILDGYLDDKVDRDVNKDEERVCLLIL